jgi:diguanylate cyclase (GGDEF)-like protein
LYRNAAKMADFRFRGCLNNAHRRSNVEIFLAAQSLTVIKHKFSTIIYDSAPNIVNIPFGAFVSKFESCFSPRNNGRGVLSNIAHDQVFSFDSVPKALPDADQSTTPATFQQLPEGEHLAKALEAAGEAAYHWHIAQDTLTWSGHSERILGCAAEAISNGKSYAGMLDPENLTSRYEAVMRSAHRDIGSGVPFRIEYQFRSEGRNGKKTVWVEDQGCWYAGPDGRPQDVYGTVRRIDDRHIRDQHLNFLGNCDPLTGMMNRGRMMEVLGEAISVGVREQSPCAFAICAVNNLPVVNDAYGFEVADEVIVALGRRLKLVMRAGDAIARFSGGKFGIVLNNCDEKELTVALDRFLAVVRDSVIETQHGPVWAMLSIGAICLPTYADDATMAVARAEESLNDARRLHSDTAVVFQRSARRMAERHLNARCATEIVQCLKTDRFKLAFQPLVNAQTGQTAMHEALLRMSDADTGELIAAGHLVPISERLGLVRLIDRAVTQMIMNTLHSYPDAYLSMNISATTATDPRWYNQIMEMIAANSDVAQRLTVEITEATVMNDVSATRQFVENLRRAGCGVAIDDFGSGYTSFRNLRELPVSIIKLDGSYCQNLKSNSENEYIVRSLIDLGGKFNLKTVAECIETEEDAEALRSWGIDYLQGNFLGEASIEPQWARDDRSTFIMTPPHSLIMKSLERVESDFVDTQKAIDILAVTEQEPIQVEAIFEESSDFATTEPATVSEGTDAEFGELDFTDIDVSILNLRASLSELREHFKQPEAAAEMAA